MDLIERLRRVPLFQALSEEYLRDLARIADEHLVEPGTLLCRQADLGATFFVIDSGEAVTHRVDERGYQRPVGMVREGDSFGATSLFLGEPRDATIAAVTPMRLWTIRRPDFSELLADLPGLRRQLLIPSEIEDRLRGPRYPWMEPSEQIVCHCRRHWIVFLRTMATWTTLLLLFVTAVLWFAGGSSSTLSPVLPLLGVLLPYGMILTWHWVDWRNDYFAVSTRRVTRRERVAFVSESRAEAPLDRIQNINVVVDFLGGRLHYGNLTIETAAEIGTMLFDHIPHPERMREAIWAQMERSQATRRATQRQLIRESLIRRATLEIGESPPETPPEEDMPIDYIEMPEPEPPEPSRWAELLAWIEALEIMPRVRIVSADSVTWRKHRIFLVATVAPPLIFSVLLSVAAILAFSGLPASLVQSFSLYPTSLLIASLLSIGWLWWRYADWGNDLYIVTNERIIDIEKHPLLSAEQRREASFGMIQNVRLEIPNVIASLFNYGNVIVQTAGAGEFTFDRVPNPRDVQNEIFRRIEAYKEAQSQREADRRRAELTEWFAVYSELREEKAKEANPPAPDRVVYPPSAT